MRRIRQALGTLSLVWVLATVPLHAQDSEGEQSTQGPARTTEEAPPAATPNQPTNTEEDEDTFVPSEEISLDKSVAFPADI